jgi:hypothetical protein
LLLRRQIFSRDIDYGIVTVRGLGFVERLAFMFDPGMGLKLFACLADSDAQFRRLTPAGEQPPER